MENYTEKSNQKVEELIESLRDRYGDFEVTDKTWEVSEDGFETELENFREGGYVWKFLEDEGEASISSISDAVDAPRSKVNMAIGWLAREDKLEFVDQGRGTLVKLS